MHFGQTRFSTFRDNLSGIFLTPKEGFGDRGGIRDQRAAGSELVRYLQNFGPVRDFKSLVGSGPIGFRSWIPGWFIAIVFGF